MIVSVHIADVSLTGMLGALRNSPRPDQVPGLRYARTTITAAQGGTRRPPIYPRRFGLIASWDDDGALDDFMRSGHSLASPLVAGWHVRLKPIRVSGTWREIPGLPDKPLPVEDEEPIAVLTLGRLRLQRARPFLRSAGPAEKEVIVEPALLASIGLARPPHLVSTFSLWRSAAAMRDYAYRKAGAHMAAVRADREGPFHHESAFIRFRPYRSHGEWEGRDPLAGLVAVTA
jgi:hypothetical protein